MNDVLINKSPIPERWQELREYVIVTAGKSQGWLGKPFPDVRLGSAPALVLVLKPAWEIHDDIPWVQQAPPKGAPPNIVMDKHFNVQRRNLLPLCATPSLYSVTVVWTSILELRHATDIDLEYLFNAWVKPVEALREAIAAAHSKVTSNLVTVAPGTKLPRFPMK